jgi:DNA-binding transcriptional LysR family regulator
MPLTDRFPTRMSHRVSMSDLEILYAVAENGSMAKAAADLRTSQPAISRAIAEMEISFGQRLFDRSRRGVVATRYGKALAHRANAVLDELKEGLKEIAYLSDPTAGELYIGSPEPLTEGLLPDVIQRFWRNYPRVRINIIPSLAGDFDNLRARMIDFQINRLRPDFVADDIHAEPIFDEKIFVVAGLGNPWTRRKKIKLADLVNEKWIVQNNAYDNVSYAFQSNRLPTPRATVAAYSAFLRNQLTARGDFLAILAAPQLLVLRNQGLKVKVLPINLSDLTIKVAIFRLKNRTLSPVSQLFLQHIRKGCERAKFADAM